MSTQTFAVEKTLRQAVFMEVEFNPDQEGRPQKSLIGTGSRDTSGQSSDPTQFGCPKVGGNCIQVSKVDCDQCHKYLNRQAELGL